MSVKKHTKLRERNTPNKLRERRTPYKLRLLSLLLVLCMVATLLPVMSMTAFAAAGDSADNPVVCTTFQQFKDAMESKTVTYIKLNGVTGESGKLPVLSGLDAATYNLTNKVITVEGTNEFYSPLNNNVDCLIWPRASLTINGNGTLSYMHGMTGGTGAVISMRSKVQLTVDGTVTIEGKANGGAFGRAIYADAGTVDIRGGNFTGFYAIPKFSNDNDAVFISGSAKADISGGTFSASQHSSVVSGNSYGLRIEDDAGVKLSGGKYKGIKLPYGKNIENYIADGYEAVVQTDGYTVIKGQPISSVSVTVSAPEAGKTPNDMSYSADGLNNGSYWFFEGLTYSGGNMAGTDVFAADKDYSAGYRFKAPTGQKFAAEGSLKVNVTGGTYDKVARIDDTTIEVYVKFPKAASTEISDINVTVSAPEAGKTPNDMGSSYSADGLNSGSYWFYEGLTYSGGMAGTDVFAADKDYSAIYQFKAPTGKTFAAKDSLNVTVTGGTYDKVVRGDDTTIDVYVKFPNAASSTEISDINVTVSAPEAGKTPNDMSYSADGLNSGANWFFEGLTYSSGMAGTDVFAADKDYSAIYQFKAPTGKTFAAQGSLNVTVTGGTYDKVKRVDDTTIELYVKFPKTAASTEISDINVTVSAPEAGKTPNDMSYSADGLTRGSYWFCEGLTFTPSSVMAGTDAFAADKDYYAMYEFKAPTGKTFAARDSLKVNVTGGTYDKVYRDDDTTISVCVKFPKTATTTEIKAANITVTAPKTGAAPSSATTSDTAYTVASTSWEPTDSPFKASTAYTVTINLEAAGSNRFTKNTKFYINGKEADLISPNPINGTIEEVRVSYTFPKTGAVGNTYTLTTSVDGGHGTIEVLGGKTEFAKDEEATLQFKPDSGYEIDKVTVNGVETGVLNNLLTIKMDGNKAVVVTYKKMGSVNISGNITSYGNATAKTTVKLLQEGTEKYSGTGTNSYTIKNVAPGTYTMKVTKGGHAERTYTVTITDEAETQRQDVKICLLGDVDMNGALNMLDIQKIFAFIKNPASIKDAYQKLLADVDENKNYNMLDIQRLFNAIKKA